MKRCARMLRPIVERKFILSPTGKGEHGTRGCMAWRRAQCRGRCCRHARIWPAATCSGCSGATIERVAAARRPTVLGDDPNADLAGLWYRVEVTHSQDLSAATFRASLPRRRSAPPGCRSFAWGLRCRSWPSGAMEQSDQGVRDEAGAGCVHMPVTQAGSAMREKALRQHQVHSSGNLHTVNQPSILCVV
jgi:hypothetical protein